jgi:hypothetical protein
MNAGMWMINADREWGVVVVPLYMVMYRGQKSGKSMKGEHSVEQVVVVQHIVEGILCRVLWRGGVGSR